MTWSPVAPGDPVGRSSSPPSVRLGADAVSVHVNLGSDEETRQVADMAAVAGACDRWNVPLMAMVYPRGPKVTDPRAPELVAHAVAHAVALAAGLGADLVETHHVGSVAETSQITCG